MNEDTAQASHEYTLEELKVFGDQAMAESKIVRAVATKMIEQAAQMKREVKQMSEGLPIRPPRSVAIPAQK